ncbi:MAG: flotillin-like FloA family protein [Planctomycetia bacterium]
MNDSQRLLVVCFLAMLVVMALFIAGVFFAVLRPWLRAFLYGTPVSMLHIVAMRLRGNPVGLVIDAYVSLRRRGVDVSCMDVERAYIDGRNRIFSADDLAELVRKASARPR